MRWLSRRGIERTMKTVNRSAFVVRPREPFLRWAAGLDAEAPAAAGTLRTQASVYLAPEDSTGREETPPLGKHFAEIFTRELEAWSTDRSLWPTRRDFATFQSRFEVTWESIVTDLATGPLRTEEA